MRLKARIAKVPYWIAFIPLVWIVAGCGSKSARLPTYMRPELMYLNHQPYSRLYVEVDTVEGVEVPDQWLNELKEFLSKHCSRPDGIEIVQDPPVPLSEVKGLPIGAASILCLDGPDPDSGPQPAYFHIFFFDRNVGLKAEKGPPHVVSFCPCGIIFNISYFRISKGKAEEFALKHELGHVLGLCKNPRHGDGTHCRNQGCLMYKTPGFLPELGLLFGSRIKKELCADCQKDLEMLKSEDADPKLAFKGPFLIRQEEGYCVASLPYCDFIIPASAKNTFDWPKFLSFLKDKIRDERKVASKKEQKSKKQLWFVRGFWDGSFDKEISWANVPEHVVTLFNKAADDPCPLVKNYASSVLEQLEQQQN